MHGDNGGSDGTDGELPVPRRDELPTRARERTAEGVGWVMKRLLRHVQVDQQLHETITAAQDDRWAVVIKPPKHAEDELLDAGEQLCRSLHGEVDQLSIEIHKTATDGIEFHYVAESRDAAQRIRQLIISSYPHAEAEIERSRLPIKNGDICRMDRIEYDEDYLFPLLSNKSATPPERDPLGGLIDTLADAHNGRCVIQTVIEPVSNDWTTRVSRGHPHRRDSPRWWRLPASRHSRIPAIEAMTVVTLLAAAGWWIVGQWFAGLASKEALYVGLGLLACGWLSALFGNFQFPHRQSAAEAAQVLRDHDWDDAKATRDERRTADTIAAQASEPGYRVSQRLVTVSQHDDDVRSLRDRLEAQIGSAVHDPAAGQQLRLEPLRRLPTAVKRIAGRQPTRQPIKHAIDKVASRPRRRTPSYMSAAELASVAGHLPDSSSVTKGGIDWAAPRLREQIPPGAPRYVRPGEDEQARAIGKNAPLVRAGRMVIDRLPGPLAERLTERGVGVSVEDGVATATIPEWVTSETDLEIDVDHRETAQHDSYGEVELKLIKEDDPTDPDDDGDVWMGSFLREIVESKEERPRDDILIGYQERDGQVREVAVDFDTIDTHIFIQGVTGGGKSTLAETILAQWAYAGYGFAVPDPSGELVKDILRWLPEFRHDDVVYYSPEPEVAQKIVGFNPFEIATEPGDQDYGSAVDDAVDRIENGLKAAENGDQWGNRMIGVTRNLSRVMIRSDEPFTLVDLHDALSSEEGREKMAKRAGKTDEWVAKYTRKIAKFDDEDLDSLLRRLNEWVESTVSRTTVAVRDSSIDLEEIVREGKILLFDNKLSNSPLSRMLGTYIWSHIWNICENRPEDEREPFCVLADEFDDLITPEMDVPEQLRNARKYKLCLVLMTQYLDAIGNKETEKAIDEECATTITLPIRGEDAGKIASRLGLDDDEYLTQLARFHALVEIEINGKPQGPYEIALPAPVAPERTLAQAREEIVNPSLDRHGREPPTDEEIHEEMILSSEDERDRFTTTDEDGAVVEDDPLELTDERKRAVVRAIHDEAVIRDQEAEGVRFEEAAPRIRREHDRGDELADQSLSTVLSRIPSGENGLIERWEGDDGDMWVKVTDNTAIYDTGRSGSSGKWGHDQLLRDAYKPLLKLGLRPNIASQDGDTKADGSLSVDPGVCEPIADVEWSGLSRAKRRNLSTQVAEDHPMLASVVLGRDAPLSDADDENDTDVHPLGAKDLTLALEAEKSTGDSKGGYTGRNVGKAAKAGLRCVLLARPDTAPKVERTLTDPPYKATRYANDDDGELCHYNLDNLSIEGEHMLRPTVPEDEDGHNRTVWIHDTNIGERILKDGTGEVQARFDSIERVYDGPRDYPRACDSDLDAPPGFTKVKEPLNIHKHGVNGEWPDEDTWIILVIPPDAEGPEDLSIYRDGEMIPLPEIVEWEQEQHDQEALNQTVDELFEELGRSRPTDD